MPQLKHPYKVTINILLLLMALNAYTQDINAIDITAIDKAVICSPIKDKPLKVSVNLHVNNIYNINTIDETYEVDGYIAYRWKDERMKFKPQAHTEDPKVYINDCARELIQNDLWIPPCELINVHGDEECPNIRIEISSDGNILFTKRFFQTFISDMNFRSFPFDSHWFKIIIEPWGYNNKKVQLSQPELFIKLNDSLTWSSAYQQPNNNDLIRGNLQLIDKWEIDSIYADSLRVVYQHLGETDTENSTWSRVVFNIKAHRLSGFYIWQILFPLFLIIMASFVMFWIHEFSTQIGVGFSLMLTVVAFNFYSASILPKLPYNTFIEYMVLIGYIFIFLGIVAVIANYRINGDAKEKLKEEPKEDAKEDTKENSKYPLLRMFRYIFPLAYLLSIAFLYIIFL